MTFLISNPQNFDKSVAVRSTKYQSRKLEMKPVGYVLLTNETLCYNYFHSFEVRFLPKSDTDRISNYQFYFCNRLRFTTICRFYRFQSTVEPLITTDAMLVKRSSTGCESNSPDDINHQSSRVHLFFTPYPAKRYLH